MSEKKIDLKSSVSKKGKTVTQIITCVSGVKKQLGESFQVLLSKDNLQSLKHQTVV